MKKLFKFWDTHDRLITSIVLEEADVAIMDTGWQIKMPNGYLVIPVYQVRLVEVEDVRD